MTAAVARARLMRAKGSKAPWSQLMGEVLNREWREACVTHSNAEAAACKKYRPLGLDMPDFWAKVRSDAAYIETEDRCDELTSETKELFYTISDMRALTLKGVMAKARVVQGECLEEGGIDQEIEQYGGG